MRRINVLSTLIIGLSVFSIAFAQPYAGQGNMSKRKADGKGKAFLALNLSEEQQTKISKMRLEQQKIITPLRDQVKVLNTEFKLLIIDEKASDTQLKSKVTEMNKIRQEMALLKAKHHRQVRALLSDEQKVKFDQHLLSDKGKKGGKRGKRGPRSDRSGSRGINR